MPQRDVQSESDSLLAALADFLRGVCLCCVFLLFAIGAYYTLSVFQEFGKVAQNPASISESVDVIAKMIDAEKLGFQIAGQPQGQSVQPGKALAFILLFLWYLIWALIPIQIVAVCSRVLLRGFPGRDKNR